MSDAAIRGDITTQLALVKKNRGFNRGVMDSILELGAELINQTEFLRGGGDA